MAITFEYKLKSANGRNWPGIVIIHPDAHYRAAVWAQEYYEATQKLNPITFIRTRFNKDARRQLEIEGHEVEVQAANMVYGDMTTPYRFQEAARMVDGYDGLFKNFTIPELVKRMEAFAPKARRFVESNKSKIMEQKERSNGNL